MAHRPGGEHQGGSDQDAPGYDWLYGAPPSDPEPTRVMPTTPRPGSATGRGPDGPGGPGGPGGSGRSRGQGTPPPRPPRRTRRRWLTVVKVVLLLWVVFLVAVPAWAWTRIDKVDDQPSGARPDGQPGHTYLLVGSDSRKGLTAKQRRHYGTGKAEGQRTDTIMLLHTGSGPNLLLSIPRDSIVEVPGHGETKINAAYAYGGPKLLVRTIEKATRIRVDSYVEVGFAGFVDVVNAVGGVRICPTQAMKDPLANLDIAKGCQHANGRKALGYARSRHVSSLGDIARAQHQREVVSAVGSKAVSPWSVLNPVRYVSLSTAAADSLAVGTDTGPLDTAMFAWAMTRVSGRSGLTCSVPIADLAVHWDPDRAPRLFRLIRQDRTADIPNRLCRPSGLLNR